MTLDGEGYALRLIAYFEVTLLSALPSGGGLAIGLADRHVALPLATECSSPVDTPLGKALRVAL